MNQQNSIVEELKSIAPLVTSINNKMPQQLPEGYFGSFAEKLLVLAKQQSNALEDSNELNDIAPILNKLSRKPLQSLPQGYFESFNVSLPKQQAAVIKMPLIRKWMTYAAAAIVAGVLITAGFVFNNKKSASFDFDYYSKMDVPAAMNQVSADELQNYLNNTASLSDTELSITILEEIENPSQGNFQQISDDELQEYLKEIGDGINKPKKS